MELAHTESASATQDLAAQSVPRRKGVHVDAKQVKANALLVNATAIPGSKAQIAARRGNVCATVAVVVYASTVRVRAFQDIQERSAKIPSGPRRCTDRAQKRVAVAVCVYEDNVFVFRALKDWAVSSSRTQ